MVTLKSASLLIVFLYAVLYSDYEWTKCAAAVIPLTKTSDAGGVLNFLAYELPRQLDKGELTEDPFLRIEKAPAAVVLVNEGSSVILECQAIGIPPPVVTWRKDGRRIKQADRDDEANMFEKLTNLGSRTVESSTTEGRLRLDCVDASMAGYYECVAENGYTNEVNGTQLVVLPRDNSPSGTTECVRGGRSTREESAVAPTIVMFTEFRFENEANNVQLFCRSSGYPKPKITWLNGDEEPVKMDENRYVLPNGDLFIRNVKGYAQYFCVASNEAGEDKVDIFVYATAND